MENERARERETARKREGERLLLYHALLFVRHARSRARARADLHKSAVSRIVGSAARRAHTHTHVFSHTERAQSIARVLVNSSARRSFRKNVRGLASARAAQKPGNSPRAIEHKACNLQAQ